jgi:hypothetical protein
MVSGFFNVQELGIAYMPSKDQSFQHHALPTNGDGFY